MAEVRLTGQLLCKSTEEAAIVANGPWGSATAGIERRCSVEGLTD